MRVIVMGASGSLGHHVLSQAIAAGHEVTAFVRTPSKLPAEVRGRVTVHVGDLLTGVPLELLRGQDALINCAGHVGDGQRFVDLVHGLIASLESLPAPERPVCWFLAGVALLDINSSGRRGVELPRLSSTYRPHAINFERFRRSSLDWRLLCPGPMVDEPAIGIDRLRISLDALPVQAPAIARALPGPLFLPVFASLIPQMIVPYADAAAVMLAHLDRGDAMSRHRVGLALPEGKKGRKSRWSARVGT